MVFLSTLPQRALKATKAGTAVEVPNPIRSKFRGIGGLTCRCASKKVTGSFALQKCCQAISDVS